MSLTFADIEAAAPRLDRRDPASRTRAPRRRAEHGTIELGNEPPLDPAAPAGGSVPRRAWSLRWLGASILTGCTGALLLGAAIYVSSEGEMTFAEPAEPAPSLTARPSDGSVALRKADKLIRSETVASARQVVRLPMTLRAGDREVIKVRSLVRVATGMSLVSGTYATDIPPFNPLRFFNDSGPDRIPAPEPAPETSDAEVAVAKSDLAFAVIDATAASLADDDVAELLQEEARLRAEGSARRGAGSAFLPLPPSVMTARSLPPATAGGDAAPSAAFRAIEVRVVPENVSTATKGGAGSSGSFVERTVTPRRGDSFEQVLVSNGASGDDARAALAVLGSRASQPLDGAQVRVLLAPAQRPGEPSRLARVTLITERGIEAIAAVNDRGTFVSVAPPPLDAPQTPQPQPSEDDDEEEAGGVPLYNSLYETALKQELPRAVVDELVRIFGYDVDFQRRVAPGDSFELFYATDDETGAADKLEILSATLTVGGEVHRVYRFQGDDGAIDFLDEGGRSLKKFLLRKPVVEAKISSGFGSRYHPILGYAKMHTGVDWAARIGTPILAAGNGTVLKAGWDSGYGRRIEVQHANGYVTTYNHMSGFGRGVAPGTRVRQGQIIGYVGSTGLSTGAHLHYEVVVNGSFVDPMKIRVPRGRELDGRALAEFARQRDQVTGLLQRVSNPNRLAQRDIR